MPVATEHGFYLAGGTGLGAQLKHRVSEDLDYFTNKPFDTSALTNGLRRSDPHGAAGLIAKNTVYWFVGGDEGKKVSFIAAQGEPSMVSSVLTMGHMVTVASLLDIAAMKSVAIVGRRELKDYIDMAAIIHIGGVPLKQIMDFTKQKLNGTDYNNPTFLRALCYFDDVESMPMPMMTVRMTVRDVKQIIQSAIKNTIR